MDAMSTSSALVSNEPDFGQLLEGLRAAIAATKTALEQAGGLDRATQTNLHAAAAHLEIACGLLGGGADTLGLYVRLSRSLFHAAADRCDPGRGGAFSIDRINAYVNELLAFALRMGFDAADLAASAAPASERELGS